MPRISTPAIEGHFQAAKWSKIQALVDATELSQLFLAMEPFTIYPLSGALPREAFPMQKEAYLSAYENWIDTLKRGEVPTGFGPFNATMWTRSSESLWLQQLPNNRYIARPREPFLQVQVHHVGYSLVDKVFRPMSLTQDALFWGLQFSFPQVCEDPILGMLDRNLPHADLFQVVRKWSRDYTVATPMQVDGKRENLPIRLGKQCFSWVNNHPGLKEKNLAVQEIL